MINVYELIKHGGRLIKRKLSVTGKVVLGNELLNTGDFEEHRFPTSIFRAWMTGAHESADKICAHEFDLLGSGQKKLGQNIDWQKDFAFDGKEIKIPWELSRFQFLPTLIKAYETTHNEKYAQEAKNLVHDWILRNPLSEGQNWQCAMEVAIRACNFSLAWYFLREVNSWKDEKWHKIFLKSILEHGKFILQNLEYRPVGNSNHLISDFVGLFFLGVLFPQFKEARKWKATAISGLEAEMQRQVYEDGVDYEASIPYHRLVCELFGYSALIAQQNEIYFSEFFIKRLEKMFEFVFYYTKPNGLAPQIGDNDDGRLFIFEDFYAWERRDHRNLFKLGRELFPLNNSFIQRDGNPAQASSKGFNDSRVFVMRKDDFYCIVDSGDVGQDGHGGHAHNDNLSFELSIKGEDFIIDPGTYVYNADPTARKHFRGTKMHNTVTVDNQEMNRFKKYTLFSIKNDAIPQINKWDSNETRDILDAQHSGYERLKSPAIHRRVFEFNKQKMSLTITDNFTSKKGANANAFALEWNFHFAPGISLKKTGRNVIATTQTASLKLILPDQLATNAKFTEDFTSPSYGVKQKSPVLNIKHTLNIDQDHSFKFTFEQI